MLPVRHFVSWPIAHKRLWLELAKFLKKTDYDKNLVVNNVKFQNNLSNLRSRTIHGMSLKRASYDIAKPASLPRHIRERCHHGSLKSTRWHPLRDTRLATCAVRPWIICPYFSACPFAVVGQ